MPVMRRTPEPPSPSWLQKFLGREIQRLREQAGLSREELATAGSHSPKHQAAIEGGTRVPSHDFIVVADHVLKAQGCLAGLRRELMEQWSPAWFQRYLNLEASAMVIRHYEAQLIPGLLQTPEYARAVFEAVQAYEPVEWITRNVSARIERQQVLTRKVNPPQAQFLLDETALLRHPREEGAMRAQLAYILKVSELSNVRIQVVPLTQGFHTLMDGLITILGFAEGDDCVYVEPTGGGLLYSDPVSLAMAKRRYDHLVAEALPTAKSADLIRAAMERL